MNAASACLGPAELREYLLGRMAEPTAAAVETHVASCPECRKLLPTIWAEDDLVASFRNQAATPLPADPQLVQLAARLQSLLQTLPTASDVTTPPDGEAEPPLSDLEHTLDQSLSLEPPQLPGEIGRLGGYRILKELGRGGMGVVYQAEDPKLKRLVALKAMLPRYSSDKSARQRFIREAQAMAAVHHDHIVTIFQVDESNGVPYLAMEFLDGTPLDKWLKEGRKPSAAQILRMGREIAEGLAAAHERGLIHRDVKPGNIWLDSAHKGRVKLLDFGLARVGTDDVHLTRSGAIVGTPAYMSPEQARGEKVDGRTDLFSLGCVLYRLCTGAMPFAGDTTMGLLLALATEHPKPVREVNPEIPAGLSDLVMRLLAKKPAERPASAREVVDLIEAIEKNPIGVTEAKREGVSQTGTIALSSSASAPIPPKRRRTAVAALLAGAAAILLAMAGAVVYVQTDRGTLEISTFDPDVKVLVEKGGASVDILDPKSKQQLSIHSGQYTLKLIGTDVAGLELTTDQGTGPVTLTRGGKVVVTVKRVGKPADATALAERTAKSAFPPLDEAWVQKVRDLPQEKQAEEVAAELKRRNPGFDGKMTPGFQYNTVAELSLTTDDVADLTPLRALPGLTSLIFYGIDPAKCRLSDLSPLKGLPLTQLTCISTQVSDLSPLKGMPLTRLDCRSALVSDLSPLKDMKLTYLNCAGTQVSDLSPLKDMPLTNLECGNTLVSNLSPLKDVKLLTRLGCGGTRVADLSQLKGMKLTYLECASLAISDLSPLTGMPLTGLTCQDTRVSDLSPLKDMKLTYLACHATAISDLSFLKNMPLRHLACDFEPVRDAAILRSIKTLETINDKPAAEFWRVADAKFAFPPLDEAWVQKVRDLPAGKLVEEVAAELKRRNPGFDGKMTLGFQELTLTTDDVADLTPLRALPGLKSLSFSGINNAKCRLSDLSTIKDLKLTQLECSRTQVSDLSPLKDMKLTFLNCGATRVSDLSPLKDMKLTRLACDETLISDLSPLKGMPLTVLGCNVTLVSDLSPLKGMPLTELHCEATLVSDLSPLKDMPLNLLYCKDTAIFDLSPLKGMPLTQLHCDSTLVSDLSPLKGMPLGQLFFNSTPVADLSPLKGMNLSNLLCSGTRVSDLSALRGVPLASLECQNLPISDLSPLKGMPLTSLYCGGTRVSDLSALKDMKLTILDCHGTLVSDLSPLKDMPLTALSCGGTRVSDLSFLKNSPLKNLWCDFEPVRDAEILRSIKTLETIKQKPTAEFWKGVDAKPFPPLNVAWVKKVRDLPAEKQVEEVAAELQRRNLSFDSKTTPTLQDNVVVGLTLTTDDVADLTPLQALPGLKSLIFSGIYGPKCRLSDLSTLKNLKLTALQCNDTQVSDLSPLKGMPLTSLNCGNARGVSDLSPLKGMPLTDLNCGNTSVFDLSPLKGMSLTYLNCSQNQIFDLSPLKGMPLTSLYCYETLVTDLSPLKGMPLTLLSCHTTPVSDLSPLKGMPLTFMQCNNMRVSDLSSLKDMKLTTLYCYRTRISDLSPLKGMPLTFLHCGGTLVSDLSPLKGMPLTSLDCGWTKVSDLSALKDLKLTRLNYNFKPERDGEILRSIKTLAAINDKPAAEFWTDVDAKKSDK